MALPHWLEALCFYLCDTMCRAGLCESDVSVCPSHAGIVSKWKEHHNNNNNNTLIYIAPACRMTSEALADSSSRATEFLTEK